MKYLSPIDTSMYPYPDVLKDVSITIRGTKNLFDIFFSAVDVERSFVIVLPSNLDFSWIDTRNGKEKYLSYPMLKRVLFQLKESNNLVEPYLNWVDSLLFANNKVNPFYRNSYSSIPSIDDMSLDTIFSDLDDTTSEHSYKCEEPLVTALQHRVNQLEHQLELQAKDMMLLEKDIQLRDKEIDILQLRLSIPADAFWV